MAAVRASAGGSASPPVSLTAAIPSARPASGMSSDADPKIARRYVLSASTRASSGDRRAVMAGSAAANASIRCVAGHFHVRDRSPRATAPKPAARWRTSTPW